MRGATAPLVEDESNIEQIGRVLFTDYVVAFELTAALLTIAVIGAVVLARRPGDLAALPPHPDAEAPDGAASEEVAG
jgi:NADH-quinone oxidoreductase subunit J